MGREPFPWEQKAAELEARNKELKLKEAEFKQNQSAQRPSSPSAFASPSSRSRNWPLCFPVLRHDIEDLLDVSPFKALVLRSHLIWKLTAAALTSNLLLVLVAFFTGHSNGNPFPLLQTTLLTPVLLLLVFFLGHYLLYIGALRQSQWLICSALLGIVLQTTLFAAMALGFVSGINSGILPVLNLFRQRAWLLLVFASASSVLLATCILLSLHLLKRIVQVLRSPETHSAATGNV